MVAVSAAVEGLVDEAVAKRIITEAGAIPGPVYGKNGKAGLRDRIAGYNKAAAHVPWLVMIDLDQEEDCAPDLRRAWLPVPAARLCFRIAVHEVEAWLLADRENLARFLSIPVGRVPTNPESILNPKEEMVRLAGLSKSRDIRQDMCPRPGSGRSVGPAYSSRLIEFVAVSANRWRPAVAQTRSDSLRRALACLRGLVDVQGTSP
jgi:hypothetical protein